MDYLNIKPDLIQPVRTFTARFMSYGVAFIKLLFSYINMAKYGLKYPVFKLIILFAQ